MKFSVAGCLILLSSLLRPVFAQPGNDSLPQRLSAIRQRPLDTAHVNSLRRLAGTVTDSDSSLARQLFEEALSKSLQLGDVNTITDCYRLLGVYHSAFNRRDEALRYYRLSAGSAQQNKNLYLLAGVQYNMGNIYYWKGMYDSCIHYYQLAAAVFEAPAVLQQQGVTEKQVDRRKSDLYGSMSEVFTTLKNLEKADVYIDKAIAIARKYNSPAAADALAMYMQTKAGNHAANGQTEAALRIRLAFLPQMEQGQNAPIYRQMAYQHISQEYLQLNKIDSAALFANKSLALASSIKVPNAIAAANWQLGCIALRQHQYPLAEQYLTAAKAHYESTEDPEEQQSYYEAMRELAYKTGNYKAAYDYAEKYQTISDSIVQSARAREFAEREMRYETEKKETQIKYQQSQLEQHRLINYGLIGGLLALGVILFLTWRNYKNRRLLQQQRIHELETEKQLSATQYLLKGQEDERNRLAKDLHDGLGGLLSGVKLQLGAMKGNLILSEENGRSFNLALQKLDESISEMRRVAHNMMPEALLNMGLQQALQDYCDGLSEGQAFVIHREFHGLGERMAASVEVVLYRIVQELLNNAVRHSGASRIVAQVIRQDKEVSITIEDNGIGFNTAAQSAFRGVGLRNIQSRVNYLHGQLDIQSTPGKGTSIHIDCLIEHDEHNGKD
ncbi:tetratricopeptide repeat-containing sensor histidine kinase [Paraflavitalea pollutisoli]|uniref:tetratricopeptide repeat-containing sensor histidine kinase n=1 Tax=Paraflavitalea pollutisoli TaxID=3034143 RepID=UPI0023EC4843|nr:ATP-binding protein [Paraflavitalea sp. H1-2-19X]